MVGAFNPAREERGGRHRQRRPAIKTSASTDGQRRLAHGSTGDCSRPSGLGTYRRFRQRFATSGHESCLIVGAENSASLRALLEGSDCAYMQQYPRCDPANCQLLLAFRERCPKIHLLVHSLLPLSLPKPPLPMPSPPGKPRGFTSNLSCAACPAPTMACCLTSSSSPDHIAQ